MHDDFAPFTGFGDDQNTSIKFGLLMDRGEAPDWEGGEPRLTYHPAANGDEETVQDHGHTPWVMSCLIALPNSAAMELMQSVKGVPATLRYSWGITMRVGGTKKSIGDTDYLVLPNTILTSLTPARNDGVVDGPREATATFRRPYVASPYVGFTLLSPEDS